MNKKIVILGGSGDGEVVANTIGAINSHVKLGSYTLLGFLNDRLPKGETIGTYPVLGKLEDWYILDEEVFFIAALHKVRKIKQRIARIESLKIPECRWINIVDPAARVGTDSLIGSGTFIGPNVVVQSGALIGSHVSIRAGANIGHDAKVEDFCYLGPNSTLCGRAEMLIGAHLAPNSCVADGVRLGEYSVVGICTAVTKNVANSDLVFGVPARRVFAA